MNGIPIKRVFGAALLLAWAGLAAAAPVTFQVNMDVQRTLGAFDPAAHTVEVRGGFNGWGAGVTLAQSAANTNVYEGTVDVTGTSGTQLEYKFVMNQAGNVVWEGNVGAGGAANRSVTLTDTAQTLPVVHFNNQSAPPGIVAVTFQVNMGAQEAIGNFNPQTHTAEVRGAFNNWSSGITLAASATNANIYQGTVSVDGSAGMALEYKFVINQAGTLVYEGNVGPGAFGNRVFTLGPPPEQVLPVVYFNNFTNAVGAIPVTFRVNMAVQVARGMFDPASGIVNLAGPFNNWSTTATQLTNNPAEPHIYVGTVNISGVSPGGSVPFKFVANSSTWEGGNDRTFVLASPEQTLPVEFFDRVPDLGRLTISVAELPFDVEVTVSWTAGPGIRLQTKSNLNPGLWVDVPETAGASSKAFLFDQVAQTSGFFRLVGP
jgi:hypothetical protein